MKKYYSIINVLFFTIVALLLLTSLVFGYIWIRSEYSQFQKASEESIGEYLEAQKSILRSDVDRTMEYIRFMTTRTEEILKENTRGRTNEALSVAWNIYDKFNKVRSDNEIKEMIREALRPIRYSDGRGYFFIDRLDGVNVLYPVFPESEGQNILNLQDEKGNYVLKDEINMVKRHGEGFVTGYWKKPSQENGSVYLKISFVKLFKPFDWSIGTGEYLDDVEKKIQQD
ncbi:MAG: cache domain-containing protein, partial [Thermovirgaceae bacterium]|nr:cache domain-containing protein [Thermovirgaceae bacterium]